MVKTPSIRWQFADKLFSEFDQFVGLALLFYLFIYLNVYLPLVYKSSRS